jgi:hypothetical protein
MALPQSDSLPTGCAGRNRRFHPPVPIVVDGNPLHKRNYSSIDNLRFVHHPCVENVTEFSLESPGALCHPERLGKVKPIEPQSAHTPLFSYGIHCLGGLPGSPAEEAAAGPGNGRRAVPVRLSGARQHTPDEPTFRDLSVRAGNERVGSDGGPGRSPAPKVNGLVGECKPDLGPVDHAARVDAVREVQNGAADRAVPSECSRNTLLRWRRVAT